MNLTEIVAFSGLFLSLITLSLTIYKDYFRKPKLSSKVKKLTVFEEKSTVTLNFQVSVRLIAKNGDIYLNAVKIINEGLNGKNIKLASCDSLTPKLFKNREANIEFSINELVEDIDLTKLNKMIINTVNDDSKKIRLDDFLIKNQQAVTLNFYFYIYNPKNEHVPFDGWKMVIENDYQTIEIPMI